MMLDYDAGISQSYIHAWIPESAELAPDLECVGTTPTYSPVYGGTKCSSSLGSVCNEPLQYIK